MKWGRLRDALLPAVLSLALLTTALLWAPAGPPPCPLTSVGAPAPSWPTTGDTIHVVFTSNGAAYVNYQTLALYGTFLRAQRMRPGGDKMVAITRILHRYQDDDLSDYVPTFRTQPTRPECDGRPGRVCRYVVAERPGAVRQFLEAAQREPTLIQAPWLYLIETDYLFLKPVPPPGPAESPAARPQGFHFFYLAPHRFPVVMARLYPPGLGPVTDIPPTGPAPVMARVAEWQRVVQRWEAVSAQMEGDDTIVKKLGWVREMYAFGVACAVERLDLELQAGNSSTGKLIIQPPVDLRVGQATQFHYTWGPKLKQDGVEVWRFEKRDRTNQSLVDTAEPYPLPPSPWRPGWLTPSVLLKQGKPTSEEDYNLILLEVQTFNAGLQEIGGARWREVLGRRRAAAASGSPAGGAAGGGGGGDAG